MAGYTHSVGGTTWRFDSLREVMAKASPARSGDFLAEVAAGSDAERVAAQMCLAQIPLVLSVAGLMPITASPLP